MRLIGGAPMIGTKIANKKLWGKSTLSTKNKNLKNKKLTINNLNKFYILNRFNKFNIKFK